MSKLLYIDINCNHDTLCVNLQFIEVQDQNRLLESQTLSLQQRLNNLLVSTVFYLLISCLVLFSCRLFVVLVSLHAAR